MSSKEPSHLIGLFKYPQHMFWLRNNKNNFPLRTLILRMSMRPIIQQVLAFQKSWRSFSPIIVCILAHCVLPFWTSRACTCRFILSSDYLHLNCDLLRFNTRFQRGCCLIFWKHPTYAWYVMVMYLACDTFMENHLTTLDSTFFLKLMQENQGHSGRLTVYVQTPWPQYVFINQIWDS